MANTEGKPRILQAGISPEDSPNVGLCGECAKMDFEAIYKKQVKHDEFYPIRVLGPFGKTWPAPTCALCAFFADVWNRPHLKHHDKSVYIGLISTQHLQKYSFMYKEKEGSLSPNRIEPHIVPLHQQPKARMELSSGTEIEHHHQFHRSVLVLSAHVKRRSAWIRSKFAHEISLDIHSHKQFIAIAGSVFVDLPNSVSQPKISVLSVPSILTDFSRLRGWLDLCAENHKDSCCAHDTTPVHGFRLLDCRTRQIVPAETTYRYTALSYVWGAPDCVCHELGTPLTSLPRTIEDAVQVTLKLGIQFLWVDRYCIPEERATKHLQISMMDAIFMAAELTIIAEHGSDANSGLTGVSIGRDRQPRLRLGPWQLTSALPNPGIAIRESKWNSRGWTYQEGLLSRRCLFFSKEQVYFECRSSTFLESLEEPRALVLAQDTVSGIEEPDADPLEIGEEFRVFPTGPLDQIQKDPWLIKRRLAEYTRRRLTYTSDSLNAFLGILSRFSHPRFSTSHIVGIPILWSNPNWSQKEGFAVGLCWELVPGMFERIDCFPSWSWAGWRGGISPYIKHYYFGLKCPPGLQFGLESENGQMMSWDQFESNGGQLIQTAKFLPRYLHIESWTTSCRLSFNFSQRGHREWMASFQNHLGTHTAMADINKKFESVLDVRDFQIKDMDVLVLGDPNWAFARSAVDFKPPNDAPRGPFLLILEDKGEWYERVGSIDLSFYAVSAQGVKLSADDNGADLSKYLAGVEWRKIRLG